MIMSGLRAIVSNGRARLGPNVLREGGIFKPLDSTGRAPNIGSSLEGEASMTKQTTTVAGAALALALALTAAPGPAPVRGGAAPGSAVTAVVGARVLTGTGLEIDNGVVLIEGGKIKAVGPAAAVPVPPGAKVVDAAGRVVTPGLVRLALPPRPRPVGRGDRGQRDIEPGDARAAHRRFHPPRGRGAGRAPVPPGPGRGRDRRRGPPGERQRHRRPVGRAQAPGRHGRRHGHPLPGGHEDGPRAQGRLRVQGRHAHHQDGGGLPRPQGPRRGGRVRPSPGTVR
ncbi:MAG: hypothetical protein MZV70_70530 [Desulfobacterales bacterium]|nr:hypothetical protein [Desulfobacterales bacterium]